MLSQLEPGTLLLLVAEQARGAGFEKLELDLPPLPDPLWTESLMWAWGAKPVHSVHEAKAMLVRVPANGEMER